MLQTMKAIQTLNKFISNSESEIVNTVGNNVACFKSNKNITEFLSENGYTQVSYIDRHNGNMRRDTNQFSKFDNTSPQVFLYDGYFTICFPEIGVVCLEEQDGISRVVFK